MIASKQKSPWEISDSLIKAQRVDVDRVNRLTRYAGIKDGPPRPQMLHKELHA